MFPLLGALALLFLSGLLCLAWYRSPLKANRLGAGSAVVASTIGIVATVWGLLQGGLSLQLPWSVPYGAFSLGLDRLTGLFLILIFLVGGCAAAYGMEYVAGFRDKRKYASTWFFFNTLLASMALVVLSRNAVLFLMAWELMAITAFFLVTFEDELLEVRKAGQVFLIASQLGAVCLLAMFVILGKKAGSFDFEKLAGLGPIDAGWASVVFLLALAGFGSKAGFFPFHVWLPDAHPAAPSFVSAIMSGVMIKLGIYGLLRVLTFLGPALSPGIPAWWAWLLIGLGAISAVGGILFAAAQHDLKRFLAYSSVENIGIIAMGLGLGLLGWSRGVPLLFLTGFAGAIIHVLNHALFKSSLFLGAGTVVHAAGTRQLNALGGLLKKLPGPATAFLVGMVALVGLPPLNGFVGEFLLYFGAFNGLMSSRAFDILPPLTVIFALVMAGGIAMAGFASLFGGVFLGEPRTKLAKPLHLPGPAMRISQYLLVAACVACAVTAPSILRAAIHTISGFSPGVPLFSPELLSSTGLPSILMKIVAAGASLLVLIALAAGLRRALLRGRPVRQTVTWDCGYLKPTARMQYTPSSFLQPLTSLFRMTLRSQKKLVPPSGYFPHTAALSTETPDVTKERFYEPLFGWADGKLAVFRRLQHGNVQLYILYIALALVGLIVWKLGAWV